MTTGCDRCDRNGPELPTMRGASVALHRALHSFGRAIVADTRAHWRRLVVVYVLILLIVIVWGR